MGLQIYRQLDRSERGLGGQGIIQRLDTLAVLAISKSKSDLAQVAPNG